MTTINYFIRLFPQLHELQQVEWLMIQIIILGAISGTTGEFIHGGLDPTLTYWYRLAAYIDDGDGKVDANDSFKLSTNELSGTPYPVECTSTASESVIADNDPDLLVYYPFDRDLNDYSPDNGSRANGYPYNLVDTSNSITFGEGCAFGISAYFDGDLGKSSNSANDGTYAENTSFKQMIYQITGLYLFG